MRSVLMQSEIMRADVVAAEAAHMGAAKSTAHMAAAANTSAMTTTASELKRSPNQALSSAINGSWLMNPVSGLKAKNQVWISATIVPATAAQSVAQIA